EDETALILWALWFHFEKFHDVEFVKPLYKPMIKTIGDFLARYREPHTRLPAASYDLWEERRGIAAFTVGAVWAGLNAAARFTDAFGEAALAERYRRAAAEIREATDRPDCPIRKRLLLPGLPGSFERRRQSVDSLHSVGRTLVRESRQVARRIAESDRHSSLGDATRDAQRCSSGADRSVQRQAA